MLWMKVIDHDDHWVLMGESSVIGLLQVRKVVKQLDVEAEAKAIDSRVLGKNNGWSRSNVPVKRGVKGGLKRHFME